MTVVEKVVLSWCTNSSAEKFPTANANCHHWNPMEHEQSSQLIVVGTRVAIGGHTMTAYLGLFVTGLRFFQIRSS